MLDQNSFAGKLLNVFERIDGRTGLVNIPKPV
jgi:hypothetical protein